MNSNELNQGVELAKVAIETVAKPLYEDAIQPTAQSVGQLVSFPFRALIRVLQPVERWIKNKPELEDFHKAVYKELESRVITLEKLITPDPFIYYHTGLNYMLSFNKQHLKDMYVKVLASAMDKEKADLVHPSYIEIMKQLSSDEAKVIEYIFKNPPPYGVLQIYQEDDTKKLKPLYSNICDLPIKAGIKDNSNYQSIVENLQRLGLLSINFDTNLSDKSFYSDLKKCVNYKREIVKPLNEDGIFNIFEREGYILTTTLMNNLHKCLYNLNQ